MNAAKVQDFIKLAGGQASRELQTGDARQRALGAQLLLSEVLEYVIYGLGVIPEVNGTPITEPDCLRYIPREQPDPLEMVDGLADVAYTMYWNAITFGVPLEQAFTLVCDNNLEKFVRLDGWSEGEGVLGQEQWDCGRGVTWPVEVARVEVVKIADGFYAVGKDKNGKVRKPGHYRPVNLQPLLSAEIAPALGAAAEPAVLEGGPSEGVPA